MRPWRRRNRGTKRPGTGRVARLTVDGADRGRLFHARTVAERSRGLLGVDGIDDALWMPGTSWIHTVGMRFPIDAVFCDRSGRVLDVVTMAPGRLGRPRWRARSVIECEAGRARQLGLVEGALVDVPTGPKRVGIGATADRRVRP